MRRFQCALLVAVWMIRLGADDGFKVGYVDCSSGDQHQPTPVFSNPYLQRVSEDVRKHWHEAIPESAKMKRGNVVIEFAIYKAGGLARPKIGRSFGEKSFGMKLVATSGDVDLDRAAWDGITASDPFSPLPSEFGGPYIALRVRFSYNPEKAEPK